MKIHKKVIHAKPNISTQYFTYLPFFNKMGVELRNVQFKAKYLKNKVNLISDIT